jgi:hypothetical protein
MLSSSLSKSVGLPDFETTVQALQEYLCWKLFVDTVRLLYNVAALRLGASFFQREWYDENRDGMTKLCLHFLVPYFGVAMTFLVKGNKAEVAAFGCKVLRR